MSDEGTPAGWYKNPQGAAPWRYWDGERWTDHVHDENEPAQTPQAFIDTPMVPAEHESVTPAPVPEVVDAPAAYARTAAVVHATTSVAEHPQSSERDDDTESVGFVQAIESAKAIESVEQPPPVEEPDPGPPSASYQPNESAPEKVEPIRRVADRPSRGEYQTAYAELRANQRAKNAQWIGVVLAGLIAAGAYLPMWSLNGSETLLSDELTTRFMFVVAALIGVVGAALAMLRYPQGPTMAIGAAMPVACVSALYVQLFLSFDDGVPDGIDTPSVGVGLIILGVLVVAVVLLAMLALVHASSGRRAAGPPAFHAVCVLAGLGLAALVAVPKDELSMWDHLSSGGDTAIGTIMILLALVGPFAAMVFLWQGTRSGAGLALGTFASLAVVFVMSAQADAAAGDFVLVDVTEPWSAAVCALVGLFVAAVAAFGPGPGGKPEKIIDAYDAW